MDKMHLYTISNSTVIYMINCSWYYSCLDSKFAISILLNSICEYTWVLVCCTCMIVSWSLTFRIFILFYCSYELAFINDLLHFLKGSRIYILRVEWRFSILGSLTEFWMYIFFSLQQYISSLQLTLISMQSWKKSFLL